MEKKFIEVWEDTVSLQDLLIAMFISLLLGLGGYLIAPARPPLPLIFSLIGTVIAFIVNSVLFKQKRKFQIQEME